jgi:hypothetical protein
MRWRVLKMGRALFDALHAYGVAMVIATLTAQPVTLQDAGCAYELACSVSTLPASPVDLLDRLFPLPTEEQLSLPEKERSTLLAVAVLDGLLAALLTIPRFSYIPTVDGICQAQHFNQLAVANGLQKVSQQIHIWKDWVQRTAQDTMNWVAEMLNDYTWQTPAAPILFAGQSKRDLHALMTLDPSFAYSFRQPINTGYLTRKANVAIHGTRYATLLAFVGAARFLRVRPGTDPYLVFSVPIMSSGTIEAQTSLPPLSPQYTSPDIVLTMQWLALFLTPTLPDVRWQYLAYQTLQKQKRQQPLCYGSGQLAFEWLSTVEQLAGKDILSFWQRSLWYGSLDEQELLVDILKNHRLESWDRHLIQRTYAVLTFPDPPPPSQPPPRCYSLEEVRHVTAMIDPTESHPLRAVLDREKEGTVCFGQALRLLGRYNPAILLEFIEHLEPICTEEDLFPLLRRIVAECDAAKAKSRYILVPSDKDFPLLLDDIHRHGVRPIIGVLLVLSALHYPPSEGQKKNAVSPEPDQPLDQINERQFEQFVADESVLLSMQEDLNGSAE